MFCTNCGHELKEGARFCTNCGHPVKASKIRSSMGSDGYGSTSYNTSGTSGSPSSENIFSPENIQRFAPAAALLPIVSRLLRFILGLIFRTLYTLFPFSYRVIFGFSRFFSITIGIVTVGCAGLATIALIYIIVTQGKSDKTRSWIAPIATLLAAISCLGMVSWRIHGVLTVLCGIAAAILGLELFARITLAGGQLDSPFDPGAALEIYRSFFSGSKRSSSSTPESDRSSAPGHSGAGRYSGSDGYSGAGGYSGAAGADTRYASSAEMIMHGGESYFDGSGLELLGYNLLLVLVSAVTCGIAAPWMICKVYNWRLSHTVINGKRLSFNGDGASLLGHWILWEILSVITCGIYGLFVQLKLRRWELEHTFIDGEPMSAGEKASYFDGTALDYLGQSLLTGLLTMVTCGFGAPWAICMFHTWDASHQVINHRRLTFDGTGGGFFVEYLIIALLTAVTCGIYSSWGTVRMNKYIISHTHFIDSYGA